ncbi:MAG: sensor histidine kinase, partial [Candidatus Gallimonas sp.]
MTAIIYYRFVSQTIYDESVAHLTEIYRQVNQSLRNLVGKNWNDLELWSEYLSDVTDDEKKDEFIEKARQSTGFTDFYFISRDGNYCTANGGEKGNLGLGGKLPELISDRKNVVVKTVVPGKSEIMVFAVPVEAETYREFAYEAVAISFDNGDLVKALDISVYKGVLGTYVVHADGRVVVDNAAENIPQMYNFFAMLEEYSRMSPEQISSLQEAFKDETHARGKMIPEGSSAFVAYIYNDKSKQSGGRNYYFVYEHLEFDDWVVVGMVPTSVVNANMTKMQTYSVLIAVSVSVCLLLVFVVVVVRRTSAKLKKKDKDILYREELFARLSVNVDDVFLMLDAKAFRVDYISPNIEKLIGVPEQEARDNIRALDRLVDNDDTVRILDVLPDLQPDEQGEWDREYVHQQTGEVRWFHVVAICSNIQGEKKYILVMSDRTNDKKINQALEEAVAAAQSSSRAKSTFLSNMSHDIRTPMNAIIGFATLAAANSDNNEKVKDYLAKILSSGNHLLSLINDILDMSRIESGKIRIEETEANLSDMLHDIKVIIGGQIHAKQLNLFMDAIDVVDEDVICDKTRINQVLLNLLSNAVKFTPPGGTIAVRVAQLGSPSEGTGSYE